MTLHDCVTLPRRSRLRAKSNLRLRGRTHGGTVTFTAYDSKGRETERATFPSSFQSATTRPALSNASKVTSTTWHTSFNLPTTVAEPHKITTRSYNAKGMLTGESWTATTDATGAAKFNAVKTGSTYATGWGYNANSLATSIVTRETAAGATTAVETQRYTLAYATNGNLTSITDVTAGNRIGRATSYDAHGRLIQGTTVFGDAVSFAYSPRGFVSFSTEAGKNTSYFQNAIGLTTTVNTADARTILFEYDQTHRLAGVRVDGLLLSHNRVRDGMPRSMALALGVQFLEQAVSAVLAPAIAQSASSTRLPALGSVTPGNPMPGQPGLSPAAVLIAQSNAGDGLDPGQQPAPPLLPLFDPATRWIVERLTKFCSCDPNNGFASPKLTATSMVHIIMGGHAGPIYRNQSYFTEPVNQTLVDEIVSRDTRPDPPGATRRAYYVADMGRIVGMKPKGDGTFEPTREATLVVHKDNCSNLWRVRNEVITMYPGK
jgi:YD repeat-containing protein